MWWTHGSLLWFADESLADACSALAMGIWSLEGPRNKHRARYDVSIRTYLKAMAIASGHCASSSPSSFYSTRSMPPRSPQTLEH